jgi:hypothetical protein
VRAEDFGFAQCGHRVIQPWPGTGNTMLSAMDLA